MNDDDDRIENVDWRFIKITWIFNILFSVIHINEHLLDLFVSDCWDLGVYQRQNDYELYFCRGDGESVGWLWWVRRGEGEGESSAILGSDELWLIVTTFELWVD
jgi:hypothetical protein